jgi:hypothetical protein
MGRGRVLRDRVLILRCVNTGSGDENQVNATGQERQNLRSGECSSTISMIPTMAGTLQLEW